MSFVVLEPKGKRRESRASALKRLREGAAEIRRQQQADKISPEEAERRLAQLARRNVTFYNTMLDLR